MKSILTLVVSVSVFIGCATFFKSNYPGPKVIDGKFDYQDCGHGLMFGDKNGIKITSQSKSIYICSKSQSGGILFVGPLIPIFPALGFHNWNDDYRWIKFGMKKENSQGFSNTDSITITINKILYESNDNVLLSPAFSSKYRVRHASKKIDARSEIKIYNDKDFWIGIPGKGEITIEFKADGFDKMKITFEPKTGYSFGFLTA